MAKVAHAAGRFVSRSLQVVGFGVVAAGAAAAAAASQKSKLPEGFVLDLDLEEGRLVEEVEKNPVKRALDKKLAGDLALRDVLRALDKASGDERVRAVQARLDGQTIGGMAQVQELRDAVLRFRLETAGRVPTVAHASSYGVAGNGTLQLYLASAFQHVSMQPEGWVNFVGIAYQPWFFRGLLDKWKITPYFFTRREYKNAANPVTHTGFTEPHRKATCELVFGLGDQIIRGVAEARGLPEKEVRRLMDRGPLSSADAVGAGLLTAARHEDEVEAMVARAVAAPRTPADEPPASLDEMAGEGHTAKRPKRVGIKKYIAAMEAEEKKAKGGGLAAFFSELTDQVSSAYQAATGGDEGNGEEGAATGPPKKPEVAVIYASGAINPGKSDGAPNGQPSIGSRTLCSLLRKAREDKNVRAVVLRIDSPGGSALASATIHREVERLRDAGKFVVASMGNVAASGGYYIAAPATVVMAQPATITGSIGVIFGKVDIEGFIQDLGISAETVAVGKNSTALLPVGGFTRAQRKKVDEIVDATYEEFKDVVAKGRGLHPKYVESIAKGRVWLGSKAAEIGLVDEIGGIGDAVRLARAHVAEEAAAAAGAPEEGGPAPEDIGVREIAEDKGLAAMIAKAVGKEHEVLSNVPPALGVGQGGGGAPWGSSAGVQAWCDAAASVSSAF